MTATVLDPYAAKAAKLLSKNSKFGGRVVKDERLPLKTAVLEAPVARRNFPAGSVTSAAFLVSPEEYGAKNKLKLFNNDLYTFVTSVLLE
jgi:hypothetical protein